jgi:hypothetical protein
MRSGENKKAFVAARALNPAGLISNRTPPPTLFSLQQLEHTRVDAIFLSLPLTATAFFNQGRCARDDNK